MKIMKDSAGDQKVTLLLVDDNPTNLLLLTKIIELDLPQIRVLTAPNGAEGLELARREPVDGAFIDVQMPRMNGLDMCRHLQDDPRTAGIPVVLMTAHQASPELRAEGLEVGAYDFISKPISNVEMLARIKVMLRLCANERRSHRTQEDLHRRLQDQSSRLRWISGLLISGDGPLVEPDQTVLEHLAAVLPDPEDLEEQSFFERLSSDFPRPWRHSLLKLCLLDQVPLPLAQEISEIRNTEAVFEYLKRHELSIIEELQGENQLLFKPRTREMLRRKARNELTQTEIQKVFLTAADWFEKRKQPASALESLIAGELYPAIAQFFSCYGLSLMDRDDAGQIMDMVSGLSDEVATQSGWLALFKGIYDLKQLKAEGASWLELAYQIFLNENDQRGQLLSLAQQVLLTLYIDGRFERCRQRMDAFDQLYRQLENQLETQERLKVSCAYGFAALRFKGDLAAVEGLLRRSLVDAQQQQLVPQLLELGLLQATLGLRQGRHLVARTAFEQSFKSFIALDQRTDLLTLAMVQLRAAEILHATGDLKVFRHQLRALIGPVGLGTVMMVHAPLFNYFEATLALARGQLRSAIELLDLAATQDQTAGSSHLQARILQLHACCRALEGDEKAASKDNDLAVQLRREAGGELIYLEILLFAGMTKYALRKYEEAQGYIEEGLARSLELQEERYRPGFYAWSAVIQEHLGQPARVEESLRAFFQLFRQQRVNFFWGVTPELLRNLASASGREGDRLSLTPLLSSYLHVDVAANGDLIPLVQIRSCGGFQLRRLERLFDFSQVGYASRQIFALLLTAPNHALSLDQIMTMLWPDSPLSRARNNFDTALSRLRKGFDECYGPKVHNDYLRLEKGMLRLQYCQVDCNELLKLMDSARYAAQRGNDWQAEAALRTMDSYWRGEFLAGFDLVEELLAVREQFNRLRLEQLHLLARLLRRRRCYDDAVRMLQQGLALDPIHDALIRELLTLHHEQNNHRMAEMVLDNYRTALLREDYDLHEVEELIDVLGAQCLTLKNNR